MDREPIVDKEPKPYRNVKDTVFRTLFNEPKYLLELYQALHPEDTKTTVNDLDVVTLETVLVADIHNDLGFLVGDRLLIMTEAQSQWSDNILIRALMYIVKTYQNYFDSTGQNVHSKTRVHMPKPEMYVICAGNAKFDKDEITLSDAFFDGEDVMIDVKMKVISEGNSTDIINQYIIFTKVIDEQVRIYGPTAQAVEEAIRICKDRNVLKEFLETHERETVSIMVELFSQREAMTKYVAAERAEAKGEGRSEGELAKARETAINLHNMGFAVDVIAKAVNVSKEQVENWVGPVPA